MFGYHFFQIKEYTYCALAKHIDQVNMFQNIVLQEHIKPR